MITKIEIDGFKTFKNFEIEFSPFTVIAGANASGKSNLFDAIRLLSRLAETDLKTAFNEQRGSSNELFTLYGSDEMSDLMKFAVELLVNKKVKDNWGGEKELKYTRLRYEIAIKRLINDNGFEDLSVIHEKLIKLDHDKDLWIRNNIPNRNIYNWRPKVPVGKRGIPYINTEEKNGITTIKVPADGRSGSGKETPAKAISQTILSGINSVDYPHIFAAKEEMKSWKFLELNSDSLREPTKQDLGMKDTITQKGENLASALFRIKNNEPYALKDISRRLNNLLPNLVEVNVYDDKANRQYIIKIKSDDEREFSSRVLSEGTLRILTLCIFEYDTEHKGLICFEEPENGIHPFRMKPIVSLLKDLSVDFADEDSYPRQVIVNTHSPIFVGEVFKLEEQKNIKVWFSKMVSSITNINDKKVKLSITKMLPVEKGSNQLSIPISENEKKLTLNELIKYLESSDFEGTIKEFSSHE
jgi:predicted ATPase